MDYSKIREKVLTCIKEMNLEWKTLEAILKERTDLTYTIMDMSQIGEGDISGVIMYNSGKKIFQIGISQSIHKNRQRFTLAHELAHYFFDSDYLKESDAVIVDKDRWLYRSDDKYEGLSDEKKEREIRANIFAAEILMPESKLREFYDVSKNIALLAETFEVSQAAMTWRIYNLWLATDE